MREKNVREINLTKENICFANKISVEDNVIAAECTLLFDVDKYFGTTTKKDNTWISFDVCWTPNGSVHAEYRLRSFDDCCKCLVDWRLTEEEQEIILDKMEEYCMQETGKTLQELWDSYEAELKARDLLTDATGRPDNAENPENSSYKSQLYKPLKVIKLYII